MIHSRRLFLVLAVLFLASVPATYAQGYETPPKEVADLILAPATPSFSISPAKDRFLIVHRDNIPTIKDLAQEELRLAGTRVLAATNGPKATNKIVGLEMQALPGAKGGAGAKGVADAKGVPGAKGVADAKGGAGAKGVTEGRITGFPDEVCIHTYSWSPDGQKIAVAVEEEDGIRLWIVSADDLTAKRLGDGKLNMFFGMGAYKWAPDGQSLLVTFVPEDRGPEPVDSVHDVVPVIQESDGRKNPVRTYQDLLTDEFTERQFDYYATSALGFIDVPSGKVRMLGKEGIFTGTSFSPDGQYLMVTSLHRPYSYVVTHSNFPKLIEIWDVEGNVVKELDRTPLREFVYAGVNSASPHLRSFGWRADKPATVYWIEPLDGGNGRTKVAYRDRLMCLEAPFDRQAEELYKSVKRMGLILWGDATNAFITEYDRSVRQNVCYHYNPQEKKTVGVLYDIHTEDLYGAPGNLITSENALGRNVVYSPDNYKTVYFSGPGNSPRGAYPFIDAHTLATGKKQRIWQAQDPYYERPTAYLDLAAGTFIARRESNTMVPNYYLVQLKRNKLLGEGSRFTQLTYFEDPYPSMQGVTKEVVEYTRADGVKLSGTLYLPAGYKKEDGPLPAFIWAYPTEYKSSDNAGQRNDAPNQFTSYTRTSPIMWVALGYAVLNNASFPIIGEGEQEPNDTYVEQLVANAQAAVDVLVDMGVADKNRIAVGGHSYGAFMTANLLANCDLFAAGIARSGAYNRTLTPFGFQNETRTFWEAPEVYLDMSPFVHAHKLKTPILLIHGQADNNSGTFTMQSERLFSALKGNGGIARLVLLPYESHGYAARESLLHQAWETWMWLEKYVKNREP
ncbi:MAG: prolyl oligopeptidase family serine peptidase [Bacteroidales bacterium]|jgi:dipeptidyl aminopeptidase/acylaminoacyl peptidase